MNIDKNKRAMYIFLAVLVLASSAAFQGWRTLLNNFAVEIGGVDGAEMGVIQSVREIPGFLSLLAIYFLFIMREHKLAALSVIILGLGVSLTGLLPSFGGIVFTTLLMSFGFHYYETMNQSLTLQYFGHAEAPLVLGRMRSLMAVSNISVGALIYVLARWAGYEAMFALVGAVAVAAGLWALKGDPTKKDMPLQHRKMNLKKRYWLFYALTFIAGARRQIFVAFAVFLLVDKFGFGIREITILFVVNNVINYFVNPLIGRAVNRFGERKVLSLEYASLIVVFLAYAVTSSPIVAACLYVFDNVLFNFSIAIKTFFQKIADPADISSGMAAGFTITHIVAVFVPVLGGLAWMTDYRVVFVGGAAFGLISLVLAQHVDRHLALVGKGEK